MRRARVAGWVACAALGLAGAVLGLAGVADAHPLAPVLLELVEAPQGSPGEIFELRWRTPRRGPANASRWPVLPSDCRVVESLAPEASELHVTERSRVVCEGGLVGRTIAVAGLDTTDTDALVRVAWRDGLSTRLVLRPDDPDAVIPGRVARLEVARDYGRMGFGHILGGTDHLLFVFGLLLLVGGIGPLVGVVTAFTCGHSITLGLAALGVVQVPSAPVELLIALSIFWLAVEIAHAQNGHASPLGRRPWAVAGGFGLLHGLGFAGALTEAGLPQHEIPLALVSFNVGIELGQLAFVGALLLAWAALRPWAQALPRWAPALPVHVLGALAAFWCLERAAGWLAGA